MLREFGIAYQVRVRLVPLLRMHHRNQHYQKQQHPMHSLEHSNIYNIKKQTYHKTVKIIIQSLNSKGEYWSFGSYSRFLKFGLWEDALLNGMWMTFEGDFSLSPRLMKHMNAEG